MSPRTARLIAAVAGLALGSMLASAASAQQGVRVVSLDEYCTLPAVTQRVTVVYIDASLVATSDKAAELADVLTSKIGLGARERLRVVMLQDAGAAPEVFDKCWPELTEQELRSNKVSETWTAWLKSIFEHSIESRTADAKLFFRSAVEAAITKNLASKEMPDLVRVLSADRARFNDPDRVYRMLIFSHLNSELMAGTVAADPRSADESARLERLFAGYPLDLNGAEVIIWGFGAGDVKMPIAVLDRFWRSYLQRGGGWLKSLAPKLPALAAVTVSKVIHMKGVWSTSESKGVASLKVAVTDRDSLVSSWLNLRSAAGNAFALPLEGNVACLSADCSLKAHLLADVPPLQKDVYFKTGDILDLKGSADVFKGTLSPAGQSNFKDRKQPVAYHFDFKR